MKFRFFHFLILSANIALGQTEFPLDKMATVKSPDVSAFESVGFLPLNEYTGRVEVSVPIYTIKFGELSIPINISYNTGGVKVNTTSSRVGLNWALTAGGAITREIKGDDDFAAESVYSDGCLVYTRLGFLNRIINNVPGPTQSSRSDGQRDIFIVNAPGLSTQFTHDSEAKPVELNRTGAIIGNNFAPNQSESLIDITANNGLKYTFQEREITWFGFSWYGPTGGSHHKEIEGDPWPVGLSQIQVLNNAQQWNSQRKVNNPYSAHYLSKIYDPITTKSVIFEYEDNHVYDQNRRIEREYKLDGSFYSQTDYVHDLNIEKVLKKITFPEGEVTFFYNNAREDLPGAKRLIKIEVRNSKNALIRRIHFVQDYFTSSDSCNDPQCLRLMLKEVYFTDANNARLSGYTFSYNSIKLPRRFSYKQDYLGYYNGASISTSSYLIKPKIYKKEGQGKNSFLPFNITGKGYQALPGDYSLAPNSSFSKAASLEKITYPTGGYASFSYEPNAFKYLGVELTGGGLRISSQKLYDHSNKLARQINYSYTRADGSTSGSILFVPNYVGISFNNNKTINQKNVNLYELTNSAYVGYSRIIIKETGNGYTINNYTSPETYPNIYPDEPYVPTGPYIDPTDFEYVYENGLFPKLFQNMEIKRGKLLSSKIYNNSNILLKEITNTYSYKTFNQFGASVKYLMKPSSGYPCDLPNEPVAVASSKIVSERYLLTKSAVRDLFTNGENTKEITYIYDPENPFIKEQKTDINKNDVFLIEKNYYPYDTEVSSLPNMNSLTSLNIISKPVQTDIWKNTIKRSSQRIGYKNWNNNNRILPEKIQASKGTNPLKEDIVYHDYDGYGNPKEISQKNGIHIVYLWGYNYTELIGKIENATYAQVMAALGKSTSDNLSYLQDYSDSQIRTEIKKIRTGLVKAQVTTYTYKPLIGMSSMTDPTGNIIYYEYDDFNRLKIIKDRDGNLVEDYRYHYKGE